MTYSKSKYNNPLISRSAVAVILLCTALPNLVAAQSIDLTPAPIEQHIALVDDWQAKKDAVQDARASKAAFIEQTAELTERANAQQAKIEAAKKGLSTAVLKVASAKKRLSQVDRSDEDTKGEELSSALVNSQTKLNTIIDTSEALKSDIAAMKEEHEKLRSTVVQLKNAAAAAQAAFSAAEVLVEAVKSAQLVISEGEDDGNLETDFFKDAVSQAENAKKSEEAAKAALAATRKRQIDVGERLLKADEQLANAKQAEVNAYEAFANADAAFKTHQAERKQKIDARNALIAEISSELDGAQEQLEAQQSILQNESLKMQDFTAQQNTAANTMSELDADVNRAQSAFETAQATLRTDQRKRSVAAAAIVASLNTEMRDLIAPSVSAADTTTPTDRILIPASAVFSRNSATLQNTDAVKLNEVAAILKDTASRVPEGIDWLIRVDNHGTGSSGEAWFLSQNRAMAVAQAIIDSGKFGGSRVSANGLINAQPFSDATESGWLEIVLTAR